MKGGGAPRLGFKGDVPMAIRSDLEPYATLSSPSVSPDRLLSDHAWAAIVDHIVLSALSEYFDNSPQVPTTIYPEGSATVAI
jgi:hypothetical protein